MRPSKVAVIKSQTLQDISKNQNVMIRLDWTKPTMVISKPSA